MDKHAPLQKRVFTIRPDNPWNNQEISSTRKEVRRLERRWKATSLTIDKDILHHALSKLRSLISSAKVDFLNSKITEQTGKKSLFKIVDSFLLKKPALRLPSHTDLPALLEKFGDFFLKKIHDIRTSLDVFGSTSVTEQPMTSRSFTKFAPVTSADVLSLITRCPTKSSPLDHIPTFLLKKVAEILVTPITKLVNLSLSLGVFPDDMKLAVVTPLLKKPNLNPDVLNNYRPVSNLSFCPKLLSVLSLDNFMIIWKLNLSLSSSPCSRPTGRFTLLKLLF
jgi:hypothetical protein